MSIADGMAAMLSPMRRRLYHILDVILRVPPLFVMDSVLLSNMKLSQFHELLFNMFVGENHQHPRRQHQHHHHDHHHHQQQQNHLNVFHNTLYIINTTNHDHQHPHHLTESDQIYIQTILNNVSAVIMAIVFVVSLTLFLLPFKHLTHFYRWLLSLEIAFISYALNDRFMDLVHTKSNLINNQSTATVNAAVRQLDLSWSADGIRYTFLTNYGCQLILAMSFIYLTKIYRSIIPFLVTFCFMLPYHAYLTMSVPSKVFTYVPSITFFMFLISLAVAMMLNVQYIVQTFYRQIMWIKSYMRDHGLFALIESQWMRLHVPQVFRVFWWTRMTLQALFFIWEKTPSDASWWWFGYSLLTLPFNGQAFVEGAKYLLVRGCETLIAVLGMTAVLSGITHHIGCMMQSFLMLDDADDRSIGSISAILFFILALQNGLTSMEPDKRLMRLYRNFCLLFTAMLHFIHNMIRPLLFSLGASRNMSLHRHLRALSVCFFLIVSPYLFLQYLWVHHTLSTWLLAVSAFGIEVIVKVIITLLIYALFMIDAFRSSMWEQLDDYVYYVRTIGNLIEFAIGIFLFLNGTWILVFESGGTIRALMMCIHAYFNIWCQAITGLKTFLKRYHALRKINMLPEASQEQLQQFDDVCSICYQELNTARITKCNHYFHSVCLRKWLYLQDICPLCHKTLYI